MTMDVAMGSGPSMPARGTERGGRMEKEAPAFDDALAQKPAKRMPHSRDDAEPARQAEGQPPKWRLGGYGDKLALLMPFAPSDPVPDADAPANVELAGQDAELPEAEAPEAVDAPDTTLPMPPDGDPARTIAAAIASPQKQRQPAGEDGAATAADAIDTDDEAAPAGRNAQAAIVEPPAGKERAQAVVPAAAEPSPADRRAAARKPAAQASVSATGTDRAAPQEQRPATPATSADRPQQPEPVRVINARPMSDARAQTGADAGQPRVNVLGFSTSAPPVMPAAVSQPAVLSQTAAGVVAAMETEPTWRAAAAEATSQRGQHSAPVSTLRIQLNPAELGLVTARLVATGSQLEIEIRVESNDARQRLSNDADAIVKALRGIGYDIERVTIQQAQPSAAASPQQAQQQGSGQRDPFMQGQQGGAGANAGRGGQEGNNDADTARGTPGDMAAERAGGGVYI